jgi:hypothetical protein
MLTSSSMLPSTVHCEMSSKYQPPSMLCITCQQLLMRYEARMQQGHTARMHEYIELVAGARYVSATNHTYSKST